MRTMLEYSTSAKTSYQSQSVSKPRLSSLCKPPNVQFTGTPSEQDLDELRSRGEEHGIMGDVCEELVYLSNSLNIKPSISLIAIA